MDVSHILDGLNDAQREAVSAPRGGLLVLAGAGSGKTRVLVHRIAWLVEVVGASPWSVLAVTFTNKAAREMRGRIEALLGMPIGGMWVGTFHGLAHRLLRAHWQDAGLGEGFQILDSDDQLRLIKRLLKALHLDETKWQPRQVQWFINGEKDAGHRPQHLDAAGDPFQQHLIRIYAEYEQACRRADCVDFAELLLRAHELWRERPDILRHYRERFQHILVDEFQDTNAIQYAWLRQLAGERGNLFAVGDDDQSIYGWRGARVENLQLLRKDYPDTPLLRLEQNYRSTGNILSAANALIGNNPSRLGKNLWTAGGAGEQIELYAAFNEIDEARFAVARAVQFLEEGNQRREVALLYRTTAQSRQLEEALIQAGIPYRIYGGLRFFERAEIKDALAYLRLVLNRADDPSFERCVNTPPRGIGPRTLDAVRAHTRDFGCSLWQASKALLRGAGMPARAANALQRFLELVDRLAVEIRDLDLPEVVEHVVAASALAEHYQKSRDGRALDRIENLEELVNASRQFLQRSEDDAVVDLAAFLAHAALEAGEAQGEEHEDCVQLMTLHSAKGLEFPLVIIVGVEEGLFPHSMSAEDPARLEEERRLCYVGMTRAMRKLVLTFAESRRLHGNETYPLASRFLRELPAELVQEIRPRPQVSRPLYAPRRGEWSSEEEIGFRLGQQVLHPKFGEGVVLSAEGQGSSARVQVNFSSVGSKWLVIAYANLQPI